MTPPDVLASGYLLFRPGDPYQFLLMQHPTRWDLPKGRLDAGENLLQAAQRELWEETGIPASQIWTDPEFRFVLEYPVRDYKKRDLTRHKQVNIFLGWLPETPKLHLTEHTGYKWWDWSPPHAIQKQTIDPLLEQVDAHFKTHPDWPRIR
jgi:8-oxo-dGTP pyrophosphatase MutT (NUDIX family)